MGLELLTSAEVARMLGVTPGSVKRWADRGLLRCERTAGRHRRFERSEVEQFQRARRSTGSGFGQRWVERLLAECDCLSLQADLLQERARRGAWWRVAEALGPVLEEIGRRWEQGTLSVLDEHLASERLARCLARCAESQPPRPNAPRALLCTAEGEEHTLGLSLVELCMREFGWQALWSGRATPIPEVVALVAAGGADAVTVSASPTCSAGDLLAQAERLTAICRAGEVALAFGGSGPWPDWLPYGDRVRDFVSLRDWMASVERARGG